MLLMVIFSHSLADGCLILQNPTQCWRNHGCWSSSWRRRVPMYSKPREDHRWRCNFWCIFSVKEGDESCCAKVWCLEAFHPNQKKSWQMHLPLLSEDFLMRYQIRNIKPPEAYVHLQRVPSMVNQSRNETNIDQHWWQFEVIKSCRGYFQRGIKWVDCASRTASFIYWKHCLETLMQKGNPFNKPLPFLSSFYM